MLYLFREQLFAQSVEGDKFPGQGARIKKTFSHQHDFTDHLKVGHHHGTWSVNKRSKIKGIKSVHILTTY